MKPNFIHFVSLFATLLAIINPLEAIPVFLQLLQGKDQAEHRRVARKACTYALLLMVFFLLFGTLLLKVFGVSLNMIRVVGDCIDGRARQLQRDLDRPEHHADAGADGLERAHLGIDDDQHGRQEGEERQARSCRDALIE